VAAQHGHQAPVPSARGFDEAAALAASEAAVGRALGHYSFTTADGRPVALSDYRGRPVVLSLVYTSCDHTCPLIVESVARAVEIGDAALGTSSYAVLTVGFDTRNDTPARMRAYRARSGVDRAGWEFLATDAATAARLAADTGFYIAPRAGGFDQLAQVTLLDGEGRVYRQVYGENFAAPLIVEPLKQLVYGVPEDGSLLSSLVNRVRLLCTVYDPAAGRYRFSYAIFIGILVGVVALGGFGTFVVRLWRQSV
jgi:protein SCO1/2